MKRVTYWPQLFLGLALVLTFPVVITVNYLGNPDNGIIFAAYVGSWLMGGAYLAISCITSAMTRTQVVSFIVSLVVCFVFLLAGFSPVLDFVRGWAPGGLVEAVANFSFLTHFQEISKGRLDLRDLVFFGSLIAVFVTATGVILEAKKAE